MNIILAVTGSISAYKAIDICRALTKSSLNVKVILTKGAKEFVVPNTFKYLGATDVYTHDDDFNFSTPDAPVLHIALREWMDVLVVAPCSANTLAKFSHGLANDLLSSLFIASLKPCFIFPAMNTTMYNHPLVKSNLNRLKEVSFISLFSPSTGKLACNEVGEGKLPPVDEIVDLIQSMPIKTINKKTLITTGATRAPLDPVRYITNPSSGITGYELAKAYLSFGHEVILVYGKGSDKRILNLKKHPRCTLIEVTTTNEMLKEVSNHFSSVDNYISSAAISDISFNESETKLKKSETSQSLNFHWAPDILKELLSKKSHQKFVSFAAETNDLENNFYKKWKNKPVDLLIGNQVNSKGQGFGAQSNKYFFVKEGSIVNSLFLTKKQLASEIVNFTEMTQ